MNYIKKWRSAVFLQIKKIRPRSLVFLILFTCLLLIPSFLAILCQQITTYRSNECAVTLYEKDGTVIASEEGLVESAARYSLLESFYKIHTNKKEIAYAPGNPEQDHYIVADVSLNGVKTTLNCYFSLDGTSDYLIDQNGKIYTLSSVYTKKFLASAHAASFYEASVPPMLTTIDNDTIPYSKMNWSYRNLEEKFVSVTNQNPDAASSYEITGAIGLRFEQNPDQCLVSVYEQGRLIYEGALGGVASVSVSSQSELFIRVNATWKQKDAADFFGSVQYEFTARIRNRSDFSLSADTVYPGEWVLLTATNISDPTRISFSADWCQTPTFYKSDSTVYTLLAIPDNTEKTSLQFEISYGASAQTFRIALLPKPKNNTVWEKKDFISPDLISKNLSSEYAAATASIGTLPNSPPLFYDAFAVPDETKFTVGYRYGDSVTSTQVLLVGTEYRSNVASEAVPALNHGVVVQTGYTPLLGAYVVIDHGCGLRTYYCHLSRADVSYGDTVQRGQSIGVTGSSGLATTNGFLLITTINDAIIDPSSIVGHTILRIT